MKPLQDDELMDTLRNFMKTILDVHRHSRASIFSVNHLNLTDPEKEICAGALDRYFTKIQGALTANSWEDASMILQQISLECYYDGINFYGPSSIEKVNKAICEYLNSYFYSIGMALAMTRESILTIGLIDITPDHLYLLSDDDLINQLNTTIQESSSLSSFTFLGKLRDCIRQNKRGRFFIHFDFGRTRLYKLSRDAANVNKWIKSSIDQRTPLIQIRRSQKEGLRIFFHEQISQGKLVIENLDGFLNSRFHSIDGSAIQSANKSFSITTGEAGVPSLIIRELFEKIQKLDSGNPIRDIQKWLYHLFFEYEGDGFSFHNIKKVTESYAYQ